MKIIKYLFFQSGETNTIVINEYQMFSDSGTLSEETTNCLQDKQHRTHNRLNGLLSNLRWPKQHFLHICLAFVKTSTCSNNFTCCTFVYLPLFPACMIINDSCAAVQMHQCTREQHHSTSCAQVVGNWLYEESTCTCRHLNFVDAGVVLCPHKTFHYSVPVRIKIICRWVDRVELSMIYFFMILGRASRTYGMSSELAAERKDWNLKWDTVRYCLLQTARNKTSEIYIACVAESSCWSFGFCHWWRWVLSLMKVVTIFLCCWCWCQSWECRWSEVMLQRRLRTRRQWFKCNHGTL